MQKEKGDYTMDDGYILDHLYKWAELFYGKKKGIYSKKKGKMYYFGFKNKHVKLENQLTRQVALFIVSGALPQLKKKKK